MSNKIKKLICSLLAAAMLVTSAGVVSMAAPEDEAATTETTVTETAGDSSTADQTDEEKETPSTEATETKAEATEAQAAAEATEAPVAEATAAPVVDTGSAGYENDDYYKKSLALCSSLGIISGFEDGSVKPEEKVTRAQMASIVLRMLALDGTSPYQNIFTDVDSSHWAANQIQSAYEASIVSGMGDGTFAPDAEVTYAQVIVMLVNAMNYREDAEYYGGWQQGYIKEAGELELLKSAPGSADVASDRGVVIKMVYNALLADYKEIRSYDEYGQPKYSTDKTLAEVKFDVIEKTGKLVGTGKTSLIGDLQDGEVAIIPDKEDNSVTYDTKLTSLEDYLAMKVKYYYKENAGLTSEVVAVTYDGTKSEVYTIDDLDTIESVTGFNEGAGQYKINKVSKAKKLTADANIVYNGKLLDVDEVAANGEDINDLLFPEKGSVKLVKSDKNNDDFDTLFVDSYETIVVTSATDTKLIGKVQDPAKEVGVTKGLTVNLDDKEDRTISVTKAGQEIRLRNLKKNDVASMKRSYDDTVVDIVVTGESITGSASSISVKMDDSYATINGDKYEVANVAAGDLQTGAQCTFFLDAFGRVGYIEGTSGSRLASGEKYGWLMEAYRAEGGDGYMVKLMTEDGEQHYKLANKVKYWAPKSATGGDQVSSDTLGPQLVTMTENPSDYFPGAWNQSFRKSNTNVSADNRTRATNAGISFTDSEMRIVSWSVAAPIMLVKYKTNSSGNLTELYGGVSITNYDIGVYDPAETATWSDSDWNAIYADLKATYPKATKDTLKAAFGWKIDPGQNDDDGNKLVGVTQPYLSSAQISALKSSDALILDLTNRSGSTLVGGMVGGYVITDDIVEFGVPDALEDYNDSDSYTVGNVVASKYNLRENGLSDTWYVADADGTKPGAIIRTVENASKPVNPVDLDNVGGPSAMVVDTIDIGVDDDENTIYVINGYVGGSETSVTTKKTSALAELTRYNDKKYGTDAGTSIINWGGNGTVWTADSSDSLTDYIHEGDIVITDGKYILAYASAQDVYEKLLKAEDIAKTVSGSETRNYFWFDRILDSDIGDTSWMSIGSHTLSADPSMAFDIVEIDLAAKSAKNAVTISDDLGNITDVEVFDPEANEYDYAFARFANKGSLQEVIIYRIKNADLIGSQAE